MMAGMDTLHGRYALVKRGRKLARVFKIER
jgi:hypothetical protein